jgi:hypothetical protein
MMSYRDQLNMGVHIDTGAIEDPALLVRCLQDGFAELVAAAADRGSTEPDLGATS